MRRDSILMLVGALAACGPLSAYEPKVERAGIDPARYEADLHDCKVAAKQEQYGPVLAGAMIGASLGMAIASVVAWWAAVGNVPLAQSYGAISGTEPGTLAGAAQSAHQQGDEPQRIDQCLRNKGYHVNAVQ